jgi:hypothetical protein
MIGDNFLVSASEGWLLASYPMVQLFSIDKHSSLLLKRFLIRGQLVAKAPFGGKRKNSYSS